MSQKTLPPAGSNTYFLIASNCINKVFNIYLSTFLIAQIFKNAKENPLPIAVYHLICYIVVALLAYLTGNWLKQHSRHLMYRLGILITFLYLSAIILLQENIAAHILSAGIIYGFIVAFKNFSFNLVTADSVPPSKMIAFKGIMESLKGIISLFAPVVLGYFLTTGSKNTAIFCLACTALVELAFFSKIKAVKHPEVPPLSLKKFHTASKKIPFLKDLYIMEICRGITVDGTLNTVVILYIISLFKTEFNLGIITSLLYAVCILLNYAFARFCKYCHLHAILMISAVISVASSLIFICFPHKTIFIFYNLCCALTTQFLRNIAEINMLNISNTPAIQKHFKCEYFVTRELYINFGRIISYAFLITIAINQSPDRLKYFLFVLTAFLALMGFSCIKLNKKLKFPSPAQKN